MIKASKDQPQQLPTERIKTLSYLALVVALLLGFGSYIQDTILMQKLEQSIASGVTEVSIYRLANHSEESPQSLIVRLTEPEQLADFQAAFTDIANGGPRERFYRDHLRVLVRLHSGKELDLRFDTVERPKTTLYIRYWQPYTRATGSQTSRYMQVNSRQLYWWLEALKIVQAIE
jgi:hypothetical protein